LCPKTGDPRVPARVRRWRINAVAASPAVTGAILRALDTRADRACQQAARHAPTWFISGISGAAIAPAMARAVQSRITPALFVVYNATEAGGLAYNTPATIAQAPDSVGVLMPGIRSPGGG